MADSPSCHPFVVDRARRGAGAGAGRRVPTVDERAALRSDRLRHLPPARRRAAGEASRLRRGLVVVQRVPRAPRPLPRAGGGARAAGRADARRHDARAVLLLLRGPLRARLRPWPS